uniref:G-protein coupled receptors family 1 profile domain-containing protein n=1 Tax=Meloidogyne incognita TaxID=6306 RepID=A0A914MP60_MELIC
MIREINQASAISAFSIGVILNSLLIWLILQKSPKEMRVFSHILIQTCAADLIMLTINLFTEPIFTSDKGVSIVVLNGLLRHIGWIPHNLILFIWDNCFFFSFFGFTSQFIYRYLILNKNMNITSKEYFIALFCTIFTMDFILATLLYYAGYPDADHKICCSNDVILQLLDWDGNNDDPIRIAQRAGDYYSYVWLIVTICITLAYTIIFICTYVMRQYVKKNFISNSNKLGEINQQLTLNMFIQSLLPLLAIIPVWFTLIFSTFNTKLINNSKDTTLIIFMMLIRLPIHWIAVLNPLVTVLTVKHYKNVIRSVLLHNQSLISTSQNTQNVIIVNKMNRQLNNNSSTRIDNNNNNRALSIVNIQHPQAVLQN